MSVYFVDDTLAHCIVYILYNTPTNLQTDTRRRREKNYNIVYKETAFQTRRFQSLNINLQKKKKTTNAITNVYTSSHLFSHPFNI